MEQDNTSMNIEDLLKREGIALTGTEAKYLILAIYQTIEAHIAARKKREAGAKISAGMQRAKERGANIGGTRIGGGGRRGDNIKKYPLNTVKRVLKLLKLGMAIPQIAKKVGITEYGVQSLRKAHLRGEVSQHIAYSPSQPVSKTN